MTTHRIKPAVVQPVVKFTQGVTTMQSNAVTKEEVITRHPLTIDTGSNSSAEDMAANYIIKGLQFVGNKLASAYLRAKLNINHPKAAMTITAETVEQCRILGRQFNYWREFTGLDIDSDSCCAFVCGLSPLREPSENKITEAAILHGISHERAAEMLRASMIQMQTAIQAAHSHKIGQVSTWLADIEKLGSELQAADAEQVEQMVGDALIEQYRRAGSNANLISKYLIEGYAKDFDVQLPDWASCLPTFTKGHSSMLEKIQQRQEAYAHAQAQAMAEAERVAIETFGDF